MKTKEQLKMYLAGQVACKKEMTQARLAIKRVPFKDRTPEAHCEMMRLRLDASTAKELVRVAQLAYAFACGRRYWEQERYSIHPAAPFIKDIAATAGVEAQEIAEWMEAPVSPEERAAYEEHLARARAQQQERRRARVQSRGAAA